MTKEDFYKLAEICGKNRRLASKGASSQREREMAESMADCIAYDIMELARNTILQTMHYKEAGKFREKFYSLSGMD